MTSMKQQLRASLELLCSSASDQKAYLEELGTAPSVDELALEYSDVLLVVRPDLDERSAEAAARLDDYLARLSGGENASLWTTSALDTAPEWERIRNLARDVLRELD